MAKDTKIGSAYFDVYVKARIDEGIKKIKAMTQKELEGIEKSISAIKPKIETTLLKKTAAEMGTIYAALKRQLETKIKFGADYASIQRTKVALDTVGSALKEVGISAEDTLTKMSKWGMVGAGISSAVNFIRDFKNEVKGMVEKSLNLDVLLANFDGSKEELENYDKAVARTVGKANLIAMANQAKELGLDVRQTTILMAIAENAADKMGGTTEENFNKLVNATEGANKGLRGVGLQKEIYESTVKDLAKAEGDSIENLDAETQKRIYAEAIIKSMNMTYQDAINNASDSADKYDEMKLAVEEAEVSFGRFIANALSPFIDAVHNGGAGVKSFVGGLIGIGSIALQIIPSLVQLKALKEMLRISTIANTTAINTETSATVANTTAKLANLKVGLGLIGKVGAIAAVGVAIWQLTEHINNNTEAIKRNREEADKKFPDWDKSGFGSRSIADQTEAKKGDQGLGWIQNHINKLDQLITENNKAANSNKKKEETVAPIINRIKELEIANGNANITLTQYRKNLQEIATLQKRLSVNEEKDDMRSKKLQLLQSEIRIYEELFYASEKWYKKGIELIKAQTQDLLDNGIKKEDALALEKKKVDDLTKAYDRLHKEMSEKPKSAEYDKPGKGGVIKSDEQQGPLKEVDTSKMRSGEEIAREKIDRDIENSKEAAKEWSNTLVDSFQGVITGSQSVGDAFKNMTQELGFAIAKALIFKAIWFAITGGADTGAESGSSGGIGSLLGLHNGGSVVNTGGSLSYMALPKAARGGSYIVPPGYENDSAFVRVETGERLTVTPASQVSSAMSNNSYNLNDRNIIKAIDSLRIAILGNKPSSGNISIAMNRRIVAEEVTREQQRFNRGNIKF